MPSLYGRKLRKLNTIVCATLVAISAPSAAFAQSATNFTNADFLKQNYKDQSLWLNGALGMTGHAIFMEDHQRGQCIIDWYFGDTAKAYDLVKRSMERYPAEKPVPTVLAIVDKKCPAH